MHYRSLLVKYPQYVKTHREYAWGLRERAAGRATIQKCEVDPNGWILYDMWLKVETDPYASASWDGVAYLALIDGGSLIETYTLNEDEFSGFPTMPGGWDIPF